MRADPLRKAQNLVVVVMVVVGAFDVGGIFDVGNFQ
jgi:hypothetical protein